MVRHLVNKEDQSEEIAKAAVQKNGYDDMDECVMWCLSNNDQDAIRELAHQYDVEAGVIFKIATRSIIYFGISNFIFLGFTSQDNGDVTTVPSVLYNKRNKSLSEIILKLQEEVNNANVKIPAFINTVIHLFNSNTVVSNLSMLY